MSGTPDPTGLQTLFGYMVAISPLAPILALLVSLMLLRKYRDAVLRSMRVRTDPLATTPTHSGVAAAPSQYARVVDHYDSIITRTPAEALYTEYFRGPWRVAAVYAVAGSCFALTLAMFYCLGLFLNGHLGEQLDTVGFAVWGLLWNVSIFAWPTVIMLHLVAATSWRAKLTVVFVYLLLLISVLTASMGLAVARGSTLSWEYAVASLGRLVRNWVEWNIVPTILLGIFLNRRIRAVGPLVLVFMLFLAIGTRRPLRAKGQRVTGNRGSPPMLQGS